MEIPDEPPNCYVNITGLAEIELCHLYDIEAKQPAVTSQRQFIPNIRHNIDIDHILVPKAPNTSHELLI